MENELKLINNFCINDDKYSLLKLNKITKDILIESANKCLKLYGSNEKIISPISEKFIRRSISILNVLLEGPQTSKLKINFLGATTNSCYMDSVIFSLFIHSDSNIIYKLLASQNIDKCAIGIRKELNILNRYINGKLNTKDGRNYKCINLKKQLENCTSTIEFSNNNMNDSVAFLIHLFGLFSVYDAIIKRITYVNENNKWKPISEVISKDMSVIKIIDIKFLNKKMFIDDFILEKDYMTLDEPFVDLNTGKKYINILKTEEIIDTNILIFACYRRTDLGNVQEFSKHPIYPNETITLMNNKKFFLYSCVIYTGKLHYIAYFKDENDWYIYNDINPNFIKIGSFEYMLKLDKSPMTHGVLFFYKKY